MARRASVRLYGLRPGTGGSAKIGARDLDALVCIDHRPPISVSATVDLGEQQRSGYLLDVDVPGASWGWMCCRTEVEGATCRTSIATGCSGCNVVLGESQIAGT